MAGTSTVSSMASADLPVPASSTLKPSFSKYFRSSLRISGSSSTTNAEVGPGTVR